MIIAPGSGKIGSWQIQTRERAFDLVDFACLVMNWTMEVRFGVCYGFLPLSPPFLLLLGSCIVTVVCVFVLPTDLQSDYINEMKKSSRVMGLLPKRPGW